MKNRIKVSVIVPVYNVYEYLDNCLNTLVNQTLKEIEIIVVNDGSTDDSQDIIDKYAKKYPDKINSYIKENGGLSSARNYGVLKAKGEFIGFVDSDDYVDLNMYEVMYNKAKKTNSDIVVCAITKVYKNYNTIEYLKEEKIYDKSVIEEPNLLICSKSYACNKIYNRKMWVDNNCVFLDQWYEDSALIYNVLYFANKIACVNRPFYQYLRTREETIANTINPKVYDIFKSCDSMLDFYKDKEIKVKNVVEKLCVIHICARLLFVKNGADARIIKKYMAKAKNYFDKNLKHWDEYSDQKYLTRRHYQLIKYIKKPYLFDINRMTTPLLKFSRRVKKKIIREFKKTDKDKTMLAIKMRKSQFVQKNGMQVLYDANMAFKKVGVEYFADFGTLLGLVREKGLIANDLDVDVGIFLNDVSLDTFNYALYSKGFKILREYYYEGNIVGQSWMYMDVKLGICFYQREGKNMKGHLFFKNPGQKYIKNHRNVVELYYSLVKEYKNIKIDGKSYVIPKNDIQIIEEKYGKNWKVPDKDWVYWDSEAVRRKDGIGYFKTFKHLNYKDPKLDNKDFGSIFEAELQILEEVDRICKKHNITYYLGEGTLLGAIRHKGFIPWDDDIDILMIRDDYEKFLKIAPVEIDKNFQIQHSSTIKKYWSPFIKVRLLNTSFFRQSHIAHLTKNNGPLLDIFPLDNVPKKDSLGQYFQSFKIRYLRRRLMYKLKARYPKKIKGYIMRFNTYFMSVKFIHKQLNKTFIKYNNEDNKYIVNLASYYNYKKQTLPKEYYGKPRYVDFEGMKRPIPKEAEKILTSIYGDYMTPPPIEKQNSKHHFHD